MMPSWPKLVPAILPRMLPAWAFRVPASQTQTLARKGPEPTESSRYGSGRWTWRQRLLVDRVIDRATVTPREQEQGRAAGSQRRTRPRGSTSLHVCALFQEATQSGGGPSWESYQRRSQSVVRLDTTFSSPLGPNLVVSTFVLRVRTPLSAIFAATDLVLHTPRPRI